MSTIQTSSYRRTRDHFEPQDIDPHEQRRLRGLMEQIDYTAYISNREVVGQMLASVDAGHFQRLAIMVATARAKWVAEALRQSESGAPSTPDLIAFLSDLQAKGCDLYLHQQAIDTSTPSGRMLFQMLGVFAEFERSIITARIKAGLDRARAQGKHFGRPNLSLERRRSVQKALDDGLSVRAAAKATGVSAASVGRIKQAMPQTV